MGGILAEQERTRGGCYRRSGHGVYLRAGRRGPVRAVLRGAGRAGSTCGNRAANRVPAAASAAHSPTCWPRRNANDGMGRPAPVRCRRGWVARTKARTMRWVAESIAEQRLLWHMRRQTEACLFFPDDVTEASATARLRAQLGRDRDRHRFWLSIDSVGFVALGAADAPARTQSPRVLLRFPAGRPLPVDDGRATRPRGRALADGAERAALGAAAGHRPRAGAASAGTSATWR